MLKILIKYSFLLMILISACSEWEEHYTLPEGPVDENIWESIKGNPDFSEFVELTEQYSIDTIFESNVSYTVFVPVNSGMSEIDFEITDPLTFIRSHIARTVFLMRNVEGSRKLKTISGKFADLEKTQEGYTFNGTDVSFQSDLHKNGLYYRLEGASEPFENLFQYIERINPYIADYVAAQDSQYLDLELSKPIDINDQGEIIYDSVLISINLFELLYFPLSEEFRDNKATLVIPDENQYLQALDSVKYKLNLDPAFIIPKVWQHDILIPFILDHGLFEDEIPIETFENVKLKNIRGDSVIIDYQPKDGYTCSNGIAYTYDHFSVPDSLYLEGYRLEGESLVSPRGLELYAWKDSSIVKIKGESAFPPLVQKVKDIASNDSILYVNFGKNFSGSYSIEFKIENVFPGQYQGIWRSNPRFGGVYSVYINNELQTLPFDRTEFDLKLLNGGVVSVTGNQYFYPQSGYNMLDCLTTIESFGDVWVRIEYIGPGDNDDNGFIMDYFELVPYN